MADIPIIAQPIKADFVIPEITSGQMADIAIRSAGIYAVQVLNEARQNAPRVNEYANNVDPLNQQDPALLGLSQLGTPVWDRVTFGKVEYIDRNGNPAVTQPMTFESILISVTFPRNIVKTAIQGRDGTVKEYIGEGDANITFRGVICGKNGQRPTDEVSLLVGIVQSPVSIPVSSKYLQELGIYSIVFEDRSFEQQEGGYSYQTFTLNAVSDTPQELLIS